MSYSGTQYGDVTQRIGIVASARMLAHAEPILVLAKLGKAAIVENLPKNKGQTVKWIRPRPFTVTTTPLVEGVTPPPLNYEQDIVTTTIAQYGAWSAITDVVEDTHEDPILKNMTMLHGEYMGNQQELLTWDVLRAGTSVVYTNGTVRTDVNTPIDRDAIGSVVSSLKNNHAKKLTKMISASSNFGTVPVAPSFIVVGHTNLERDFRDMDGFAPVETYGSFTPISEYEIGKVEECRVILSPQLVPFYSAGSSTTNGMRATAGVVDVYPVLVFGEEAFATVNLAQSKGSQIVVKNPSAGGSYEDPLSQRGYVGWKMWFAAKILNDNYMSRIECAATSL
jgi:N4-gp56 family major capsid protein